MRTVHPAHPDAKNTTFAGGMLRMGVVFDPATAIAAVSTVIKVVGAIREGNATAKADKFNANVAAQNSQIAKDQAAAQLAQQQQDSYRKLGAIKAASGGSGVTTSGSPMDVLQDSFTQSELDANTIIYNGQIKSAGFDNTASLNRVAAKDAQTGGYIDAASKALLGGTKTYDAYNSVGTGT